MAKAPKAAEAASPAAPVDAGPAAPAPVEAAPARAPEPVEAAPVDAAPVDAAPAPAPEAALSVATKLPAAPATRDVIILQPVTHDGEALVVGKVYAIDAKAAEALIACGAAEEDD